MTTRWRTWTALAASLVAIGATTAATAEPAIPLWMQQGPRGTDDVEILVTGSALVPKDDNGAADVYVRDRRTGAVELVSVGPDGRPGPWTSEEPAVSGNGRFVAFVTRNALLPEDDNGARDVYLRDREQGRLWLVSRGVHGRAAAGDSSQPAIDYHGTHVAFASTAADLVAGDTNGTSDVFVWTRATEHVVRVSVRVDGGELAGPAYLPAISTLGFFVGFVAEADLLTGARGPMRRYVVRRTGRIDVPLAEAWTVTDDALVALTVPPTPTLPAGPASRPPAR